MPRNDFFRRAPGWEAERDDLDPRWTRLRRALLVEEFAVDAVRIADEHVGPPAGASECAVSHGEVIADDIEFRVAGLRKENFLRIADRDLLTRDRQDFPISFGSHDSGLSHWLSFDV